MRRGRTWVTLALGLLAALSVGAGADTITLRAWASLPRDAAEARLADVADLEGAHAQALAQTVVLADAGRAVRTGGGSATVDMQTVRAALDGVKVNWGRVALRGSACVVRFAPEPAPRASDSAKPVAKADRGPAPATPVDPGTVRAVVARRLADLFGVGTEDLRITFDPGTESLLAMRADAPGRVVEVRPGASGASSRVPVQITVYDGDRVAASGLAQADTLLRKQAVVLTSPLRKGETISEGHLREEERWVTAGEGAGVTTVADVVGGQARSRMSPGTVLRSDSVLKPVVVRKGDLVVVHAVSGGLVVRTPARAMSEGREGEVIEFRLEKSKKTFTARVDGKGRAVLAVGPGERRDGAGDETREEGDR